MSTETGTTRELSYRELHREVSACAAVLRSLGVGCGDRVVVYLPNIAEAVIVVLACARLGAIHSVVFGGFAAHNLALRIDDAGPKVLVCADAGMRGGKLIRYKPLVDAALREAAAPPPKVLVVDRGLDLELERVPGRDEDYAALRERHLGAEVPVEWLESNEPSYLLYTSGTTGKPKGVQRDVGGYAVAMALSMRAIFDVGPGQTMFSTSDVGWAVGHSYNIYGPLIDNYWQTETGWPVLCLMPGVELKPTRFGSPGFPAPGYRLRVLDETTGADAGPGEKGVLVIEPPLPPGCLTTVWGDDQRFLASYFSHFKELLYSSLDSAVRDADGYTFILGRTDDVINVAGHRLGTREIEELVAGCPMVAEAAVIGVADALKGQVPVVFATLKTAADAQTRCEAARAMRDRVVEQLGAVARPARVHVVNALPKTRSGKLLRRSLQALAESRDPGDLSTLDDPGALDEVRSAPARGSDLDGSDP